MSTWTSLVGRLEIKNITKANTTKVSERSLWSYDYETANKIVDKIIEAIDEYYPLNKSSKVNTLVNQVMTEMLAQKFDLAVVNLIKLKPLIKELGQYDKLLVNKVRIAVCQKYKTEALKQVSLLQKNRSWSFSW